jgi:hypothetical protein
LGSGRRAPRRPLPSGIGLPAHTHADADVCTHTHTYMLYSHAPTHICAPTNTHARRPTHAYTRRRRALPGVRRSTPLLHAARNGHADVAAALLTHGADVHAKANDGCGGRSLLLGQRSACAAPAVAGIDARQIGMRTDARTYTHTFVQISARTLSHVEPFPVHAPTGRAANHTELAIASIK